MTEDFSVFFRKILGYHLEISDDWLLQGFCLSTMSDHLPVSFNVIIFAVEAANEIV